jgi:hypothetical protein
VSQNKTPPFFSSAVDATLLSQNKPPLFFSFAVDASLLEAAKTIILQMHYNKIS